MSFKAFSVPNLLHVELPHRNRWIQAASGGSIHTQTQHPVFLVKWLIHAHCPFQQAKEGRVYKGKSGSYSPTTEPKHWHLMRWALGTPDTMIDSDPHEETHQKWSECYTECQCPMKIARAGWNNTGCRSQLLHQDQRTDYQLLWEASNKHLTSAFLCWFPPCSVLGNLGSAAIISGNTYESWSSGYSCTSYNKRNQAYKR